MFAVETRSARGVRRVRHARHVVLAIGYYDRPNFLNVPGEDLPHVHHYYSEPHPYYRQRVVIVGGGNSAAESALELFRAGAHVTLVHRHAGAQEDHQVLGQAGHRKPDQGRVDRRPVQLAADGDSADVGDHQATGGGGRRHGQEEELPADAVFLLTGYHTDWDLMERAGIVLGETRVPTYDPETFETNVPGLFLAGGAICGRDTSNIFIENGRFHGEKIVATIADGSRTSEAAVRQTT